LELDPKRPTPVRLDGLDLVVWQAGRLKGFFGILEAPLGVNFGFGMASFCFFKWQDTACVQCLQLVSHIGLACPSGAYQIPWIAIKFGLSSSAVAN